jgi:hypothetical protein
MTNVGNLNATFAKILCIFYNDNTTNRTSDASDSFRTDAWRDVHNFDSLRLLFSSGHRSPTLLGLLPPRPDLASLARSMLLHRRVPHLHRSLLTPRSAPLPRLSRTPPAPWSSLWACAALPAPSNRARTTRQAEPRSVLVALAGGGALAHR